MPGLPKLSNPFEDETDFIDETPPVELAKQAAQQATKAVNKQVVQPVTNQLNTDQAIVDFLYGADAPPEAPDGGDPAAAAVEQGAHTTSSSQAQAAKMQQIADPNQQMTRAEKVQYNEEQL